MICPPARCLSGSHHFLLLLAGCCATSLASQYEHWFTYPHSSGNRILPLTAHGTFPNSVHEIDVELPSDVEWIVATCTSSEGARFVVTTSSGNAYVIHGNHLHNGTDEPVHVVQLDYTSELRSDKPPLVRTTTISPTAAPSPPTIVQLPKAAKVSPLSHPVPVATSSIGDDEDQRQLYVYIDESDDGSGTTLYGDVVLWDDGNGRELDRIKGAEALPDGRIVIAPPGSSSEGTNDNTTLLALYGGATSYSHCVLGDCTESSRLLLVRVADNQLTLEQSIQLPSDDVFEGICPFFTPDGRTVVTTVANNNNGAWLQSYNLQGAVQSSGPYIGWGWRHMLFYNDFGSTDTPHPSLVDVLTPHVRMVLEFFDLKQSEMVLQDQTSRYTTHGIGSRILDTAVSGDFNGDCINEAVVLDESQTSIKSIQLMPSGEGEEGTLEAKEVWSLLLPGKLSSNLATVALEGDGGGGIALAAASGRTVRLWLPLALEGSTSTATNADSNDTTTIGAMTASGGGGGDKMTNGSLCSAGRPASSSTDSTSLQMPREGGDTASGGSEGSRILLAPRIMHSYRDATVPLLTICLGLLMLY
mmetsp:Transcript_34318/g.74470  ORF Transcript_34318/g.74470 Transcript_34318/m.74470 type:complete len:585 (-) Transcript_34318:49-1803(-)